VEIVDYHRGDDRDGQADIDSSWGDPFGGVHQTRYDLEVEKDALGDSLDSIEALRSA
jgi:hypothetical protein